MDQTLTRMLIEDRRFRIVSCDPKLIVQLLNWVHDPNCVLALPVTDEIPADCVVVSVNTCWDRGTIDVIIAHSSFAPANPGQVIQRCPEMLTEMRKVSLQDISNAFA